MDSNIPMYLVGKPHQHKIDSQIILERLTALGERLVTDAEVLQEITHRYSAIRRLEAIAPCFDVLLNIADDIFPIEKTDVLRAAEIAQVPLGIGARDALHIAVMERRGIDSIFSFDVDFDRWPGITRIHRI